MQRRDKVGCASNLERDATMAMNCASEVSSADSEQGRRKMRRPVLGCFNGVAKQRGMLVAAHATHTGSYVLLRAEAMLEGSGHRQAG